MGTRKTPLVFGEYYHIYNRGNSRQTIFHDDEDYHHFCKLLYLCNSTKNINFRDMVVDAGIDAWNFNKGNSLVSIGAWVLMPNHFHIYIKYQHSPDVEHRGEKEGTNHVTEFMRKLGTAYAKYFNSKYARSGSLFEGSFKSVHIENDSQAKYLFSYIHLNPIKLSSSKWKREGIRDIATVKKFLEKYPWSSYLDHIGINRPSNKIISLRNFPKYFRNGNAIKKEIFEWLSNEQYAA